MCSKAIASLLFAIHYFSDEQNADEQSSCSVNIYSLKGEGASKQMNGYLELE